MSHVTHTWRDTLLTTDEHSRVNWQSRMASPRKDYLKEEKKSRKMRQSTVRESKLETRIKNAPKSILQWSGSPSSFVQSSQSITSSTTRTDKAIVLAIHSDRHALIIYLSHVHVRRSEGCKKQWRTPRDVERIPITVFVLDTYPGREGTHFLTYAP